MPALAVPVIFSKIQYQRNAKAGSSSPFNFRYQTIDSLCQCSGAFDGDQTTGWVAKLVVNKLQQPQYGVLYFDIMTIHQIADRVRNDLDIPVRIFINQKFEWQIERNGITALAREPFKYSGLSRKYHLCRSKIQINAGRRGGVIDHQNNIKPLAFKDFDDLCDRLIDGGSAFN